MPSKFVVKDSSNVTEVTKAQRESEDRDRDISFIMSTERGRRWVYELIFGKCHMLANSHVPNSSESTAYNEGVRNLGIQIHNEAKQAGPVQYMKMLEENHFDE